MTQPKIYVNDGTGSEVLDELNQIVEELKNQMEEFKNQLKPQVGSTEPDPTLAVLLWADTASGQLKVRNTHNTDWIALGTLDQSGLFVGQEAITSDKLANQAVTLSKIERGPAGTILVSRGSVSDPTWENVETARRNQDPALTGQGSDHDPTWRALPDNTFDGWQVGDSIQINMSSAYFLGEDTDEVSGTVSANVTISTVSKDRFTFEGTCRMDLYDVDMFFNDHYSHSGPCNGYVTANYYSNIVSNGTVQFDAEVGDRAYWDASGYVSVYRRSQ